MGSEMHAALREAGYCRSDFKIPNIRHATIFRYVKGRLICPSPGMFARSRSTSPELSPLGAAFFTLKPRACPDRQLLVG
jgi:hypothetical protein